MHSVFSFISKVMCISPFISETDTPKSTLLVTEVEMISLPSPIIKLKSFTPSGIQSSFRTIKIQRDPSLVLPGLSLEIKLMPSSRATLWPLLIMNLLTFLNSEMSQLLLLNTSTMDSLKEKTRPSPRITLINITQSPFRELPWPPQGLLI